ncbi:hypothetical protein [Bradyrhizobium liaoningense]|uniref:hypothetical protein n=1 Tax=Bradyrhizobium liaoningense TaxID=43992 RepID=UPI001BA55208|nr:hypothetical protein [Bradyrhizobium liaoningense]MBR0905350.1 hypothetical protein [Bradyrhizobium liaoningense]
MSGTRSIPVLETASEDKKSSDSGEKARQQTGPTGNPSSLAAVNHSGPRVALHNPQSAQRVGFGPSFGVKLRGVWLFASLAWAQITDDKRFKLLMNWLGRAKPI